MPLNGETLVTAEGTWGPPRLPEIAVGAYLSFELAMIMRPVGMVVSALELPTRNGDALLLINLFRVVIFKSYMWSCLVLIIQTRSVLMLARKFSYRSQIPNSLVGSLMPKMLNYN